MSQRKTVQRTIKIPIEYPKPKVWDKTWHRLRVLAMHSASFANEMLNERYAQAKGLEYKKQAYKDWSEELGSYTRDAVSREVQGMWARNGKSILRGDQTLGRFTADRCLCCRERGVKLRRTNNEGFSISLTFEPTKIGQCFEFDVYHGALKKDHYLASTLDKLAAGVNPITKASVVFERPGRKVFVVLSYSKDIAVAEPSEGRIAKVLLDEHQSIYVSSEGQELTFGYETHHLRNMKENFAQIHARIRNGLGRRRRYDRMRQVLKNHGNFESWSEGPVHQLTAKIVEWCSRRNVSQIVWAIPDDSGLPSHKLMAQVTYKGQEAGISVYSQTQEEKRQKAELRKNAAIARSQAASSEEFAEE